MPTTVFSPTAIFGGCIGICQQIYNTSNHLQVKFKVKKMVSGEDRE